MSSSEDAAGIGAFLKARRAALDPAALGLPPVHNQRRVQGLRREEAAQLAGISVDYYTRLEQGRAPRASSEVLDAVARGLRLDAAQARYLHGLAGPRGGRRTRVPASQRVRPQVQQLLDTMAHPAVLYGRCTQVLAWNRLGAALYPGIDAPGAERNASRRLFLDPDVRALYPDVDSVASDLVAGLRAEAGRRPDDPELTELVGHLSLRSPAFAALWASQQVREKGHGTKVVRIAPVGELHLAYQALRLADDPEQVIMAYSAASGSATAQALAVLGSWVATSGDAARPAVAERDRNTSGG